MQSVSSKILRNKILHDLLHAVSTHGQYVNNNDQK
jgi:hypothetical protein